MGFRGGILQISGGDLSDWVSGTSAYTAPTGYFIYAIEPGSDGCTIDTGTWLQGKGETASTITDAVGSQWIDSSVTAGPIIPKFPVVSITLSAGTCAVYMRKTTWR